MEKLKTNGQELASSKALKRIMKRSESDPARFAELRSNPITSFEDMLTCFRLVYRSYHGLGYIPETTSALHFRLHQLLPTSVTFVAKYREKIVGTGSLVSDSTIGMPSSAVFPEFFRQKRAAKRKVVEGTLLTCKDLADAVSHKKKILRAHEIAERMIAQGIRFCMLRGDDDFCVVVNPAHARFWREIIGFTPNQEGERVCHHVDGAPGLLMNLDLKALREGTLVPNEYLKDLLAATQDPASFSVLSLSAPDLATLLQALPIKSLRSYLLTIRELRKACNMPYRAIAEAIGLRLHLPLAEPSWSRKYDFAIASLMENAATNYELV